MQPEIVQDQNLCVKTKTPTVDLVLLLREYTLCHLYDSCMKFKTQIIILLVVFLWWATKLSKC